MEASGARRAATPAVAFVGKSGSGKTTLVEKIIAELASRGHSVGSVKHHGYKGFDIDIPGKDSWRHAQAGAIHTIVASPDKMAEIKRLDRELDYPEIINRMNDVDIVVIEGFRHAGAPAIDLFRVGNPADKQAWERPGVLESQDTIAVATDIHRMSEMARSRDLCCFSLDDVAGICDLIERDIMGI